MGNPRWNVWLGLVVGTSLLLGCKAEEDDTDEATVSAAWVYVGPPGDMGFIYAHDLGRLDAEAAIDGLDTNYVVASNAAAALRAVADEGNDIIFTLTFGEAAATVSAEYPTLFFEEYGTAASTDNLVGFDGRMYQPRYLSGMVAGAMTTSDIIGYVAAFPTPAVIRGINAFTLGARSINPDATVHVAWSNTYYDPTLERSIATTLIGEGADVIAQHQDTTGPVLAAQEAGVYAIGYHTDVAAVAPDTVLTCVVWNWGEYYTPRIREVVDGTWTNTPYWGGLADGVVDLIGFHEDVPTTVRDQVTDAKADLTAGTWHVFDGPFNKQNGTEWIAAGATMSDGDLLGMMAFVEGVVGTIE